MRRQSHFVRLVTLAVALVTLPVRAAAHGGAGAAWTGPSGWDIAVLCVLTLAGACYAIGSRRMADRGVRPRPVAHVAFWTGWAALIAAVAPPLDRLAALRFSSHMAQHELLVVIGAPLMIVGRPIVPWLWAMPRRMRRDVAVEPVARGALAVWRWLTRPLVAWALHGLVIWVWHAPALYEAAVRSEALHAAQHATFVATAVLFWWGLIYGRYGRAAYGASALFVFSTSVHTGVLGALFTFAESPLYPLYAARAADAGVDALVDQQLAGLYMWIPGGLVFTLFGLAFVLAWLSDAERRAASFGT